MDFMKFFRRKLKNGITVVMEKRDLGIVTLGIVNRFGGAYETVEEKGVAHFIEHLLFTGTKERTSEEISRAIEKKGGILNAFTANEMTCFWFTLPSEHLFSGLDILTDMLKNTKFDEEKFEKEKKVILEEIKMYNDNPRARAQEKLISNLYDEPFGIGIIGTKKSVSELSRDRVKEIYWGAYNPENYIVSVVGNGDFEEICNYFEKNFEGTGKKVKKKEIKKRNSGGMEERAGIDQANFFFGIHAPLEEEKENYVLHVLDAYLAYGMSSRLFIEIREKRGLAYAVGSSLESEKDYAFYEIYVGTTKDKVDEVKKIILEEFGKIKDMTEEDLQKAKETAVGLRKISSEESKDVMKELAVSEMVGNVEDYYKYEEKINSVTLKEVKKLAKIEKYSSFALVPK